MSLLLNFLSDNQYIKNGSFRHVYLSDNWNRNVSLSRDDYLYLQVEYSDPCTGEYLFTTIAQIACDFKTNDWYTFGNMSDLGEQDFLIGFKDTSWAKFVSWDKHRGGVNVTYALYYQLMHLRYISVGKNFEECLIRTVIEAVIG